jgi:phosphoglycerol transferase MdoB-like AlkP superfamily enzyme
MRPSGYDREAVLLISQTETEGLIRLVGAQHPHILMVMGEAFSEVSMSPHFCFENFIDPLENWQEIIAEGIHGEIIVPVHGGGTAQTEFDVLTGLNARQFPGAPHAFRMITSEFESMASILNSLGFRSEFMHPGHSWFYNRQNVYRHLGFERMVFIDEFDEIPTKGAGYINEHDTINRLMEMFADHRENFPNTPYFNFTVTIQNHGPFTDKYIIEGGHPLSEANFSTNLDFSDADINVLANYFYGLNDADIELRRLTNYLNALNEPVILVYFGDHMPALSTRIYDILFPNTHEPGSFGDLTRLFNVPFLIWLNTAALNLYEIQNPAELLRHNDENLVFSSSFLGAFLFEILNFKNISPFWDFNAQLRRKFPVITETRSFAPCRTPSDQFSDEERAPLLLYRDWSYFRIFDER